MLKLLKNEAHVYVELSVETPLTIRSGNQNALDPTLPDDQIVRQYKDGRYQEVIPGSSLKGVFRSRAEQLLRGMGYEVDDPFVRKSKSNQAQGDGEMRYHQSCPVSKLFGSLSLKSRIQFADAYLINVDEVITDVRNGVGINRITGGAQGGALFNAEVIDSGRFATNISLQNFELWQLSLVLWLIKDLDAGYMRLGSSTSRGFGKVSATVSDVVIRSYENIRDTHAPIQGYYEHDQTEQVVNWQLGLYYKAYSAGEIDTWIGDNGLLENVSWPTTREGKG